jgi:hypothetical protein
MKTKKLNQIDDGHDGHCWGFKLAVQLGIEPGDSDRGVIPDLDNEVDPQALPEEAICSDGGGLEH